MFIYLTKIINLDFKVLFARAHMAMFISSLLRGSIAMVDQLLALANNGALCFC